MKPARRWGRRRLAFPWVEPERLEEGKPPPGSGWARWLAGTTESRCALQGRSSTRQDEGGGQLENMVAFDSSLWGTNIARVTRPVLQRASEPCSPFHDVGGARWYERAPTPSRGRSPVAATPTRGYIQSQATSVRETSGTWPGLRNRREGPSGAGCS